MPELSKLEQQALNYLLLREAKYSKLIQKQLLVALTSIYGEMKKIKENNMGGPGSGRRKGGGKTKGSLSLKEIAKKQMKTKYVTRNGKAVKAYTRESSRYPK